MTPTLSSFAEKHCQTAELTVPLTDAAITQYLGHFPGWSRVGSTIQKTYTFADYYETIAFVNAIAQIAHQENHHPDLSVHYNRCEVTFSTHAVQGIAENDFICAAKIEAML